MKTVTREQTGYQCEFCGMTFFGDETNARNHEHYCREYHAHIHHWSVGDIVVLVDREYVWRVTDVIKDDVAKWVVYELKACGFSSGGMEVKAPSHHIQFALSKRMFEDFFADMKEKVAKLSEASGRACQASLRCRLNDDRTVQLTADFSMRYHTNILLKENNND